jgi:hypothetical protein
MRNILVVGILLLTVAGCENTIGPFRPRSAARVDDPNVSISEQQRRGRARLPLPDESPEVGPYAGTSRSTVWGGMWGGNTK